MNPKVHQHFVKVFGRRFLVYSEKTNNGFIARCKFKNLIAFSDKNEMDAVDQMESLLEIQMRLLLKNVVKILE